MSHYVRRTLQFTDESGHARRIDETELASSRKPIVILAEPGMGKTYLLRRLEKLPGHVFRSAASFVAHPDPARLVPFGTTILIDGLDELSAAQESDPVYRVLRQLIAAGCPPFVLSCRAADWRGAVARQDIAEDYAAPPVQMWLEPFTRENAIEFLSPRLGPTGAEALVDALEARGIPDLYGNPLTLDLFAAVTANGAAIPDTRAALLEEACRLMCRETNDRRHASTLSALDIDTALAAAGAVSAAFVLTGAQAIARLPSSALDQGTLSLVETSSLPGGARARAALDSRLFAPTPGADDRFKPIHRSIAEFLGAQWLARSLQDDLACERLLASLTVDDGVPASVRGIHAWLARDPRLAVSVIRQDPYGVLRYGDADGLSVAQGRELLQALRSLQETNPYFRAGDWGTQSAKGVTHLELLPDVRSILVDEATTFHLRTLLLGILRDTPLAAALADDLEHILFGDAGVSYAYAERYDAALALIRLETHAPRLNALVDRLNALVDRLVAAGDEDATRLALDIMHDVGFGGFGADAIATAILAYLGLAPRAGADNAERRSTTSLFTTARTIPDPLVADVLDSLARYLPEHGASDDPDRPFELETLVSHLVSRQLRIEAPRAPRLLAWLRIAAGRHAYRNEDYQQLTEFIGASDEVRREFQLTVMLERDGDDAWSRIWNLAEINPALSLSAADVVHHLTTLVRLNDRSAGHVGAWRELASIARGSGNDSGRILDAARPFASGQPDLEKYLEDLLQPLPTPQWELDRTARRQERDAKAAQDKVSHRAEFQQHDAELRAGELRWVHPVAQAYLGLFSDIPDQLAPADRIGHWLGAELQASALHGFEAVLHRTDLPTPQVVSNAYAASRRWHIVLPMIAGVVEHVRAGRPVDELPPDVVTIVLIALANEHLGDRIADRSVIETLEATVRRDAQRFELWIRLLIEPALAKPAVHISGLYAFAHSLSDSDLSRRLAAEWIEAFPDLSQKVEDQLTDILLRAADFDALRRLVPTRLNRELTDDKRRLSWRALGLLCDFGRVAPTSTPVGSSDRDLLWFLRDRLGSDSRRRQLGVEPAPALLAWIVAQFRSLWPSRHRPTGTTSGDTNPSDATEFIETCIDRLAADTSDDAATRLRALAEAAADGYTPRLRYAYDQQRRSRREINFAGISLSRIKSIIETGPPASTDDLLAVVGYALGRLQLQLRGNDTDIVGKYWRDDRTPRPEDVCTDRLIEDLERLLPELGISRIPQRDMPAGKRADIAYAVAGMALPVECKCQWNDTLWTAASAQLDALYVRDWQAQDRGLYVVYWFGPDVPRHHALQPDPSGAPAPSTPAELRHRLIEALPPARRPSIGVVVLDLTRP